MVSANIVFNPASIAVVGASADEQREKSGWVGRLIEFGYKGKIYPINPKAKRILGCKAYPSVKSVPESVDLAIIAVKSGIVPHALEECIAKKVKVAHIYTAGFNETGKEEGKALYRKLEEIICLGETRVIGPNCMGIYCPESGMTFSTRFSPKPGPVSLVSQSGAALVDMIPQANKKGIYFRNAVSYGNAIDLDSFDFIEAWAQDPETKLVFCYIEGTKDGRHLLSAVKECAKAKPVILLKGGMSKGGVAAAASHTASMGGATEIWQAFFKQCGVISVNSFDEAILQIMTWQCLAPPKGRGVGIVARGGGPGVVTTDQCERVGLQVAPFSFETINQLEKLTGGAGSMFRNPVEIGLGRYGISEHYAEGLKIVASDPHVDLVLTMVNPQVYSHYGIGAKEIDDVANLFIETSRSLLKPMAVVMPMGDSFDITKAVTKAHEKCIDAGVAVFADMEDATTAISKLIAYYEHARTPSYFRQS